MRTRVSRVLRVAMAENMPRELFRGFLGVGGGRRETSLRCRAVRFAVQHHSAGRRHFFSVAALSEGAAAIPGETRLVGGHLAASLLGLLAKIKV